MLSKTSFFSWLTPFLPPTVTNIGAWIRDRLASNELKLQESFLAALQSVTLPGTTTIDNLLYLLELHNKVTTEKAVKLSSDEATCYGCLLVLMDEKLKTGQDFKKNLLKFLHKKLRASKETSIEKISIKRFSTF